MKKTIMLIDDSVTIHRVIDLCVDKEKYNVVKVFNKDEAEQVIVSDKPDLILLDNKLPDIPTADMITLIKSECPACYIILLAGAFDQFDKDQCVSAGADDYLFKPFDAKALDAKILCGLEGECGGEAEDVQPEFSEEELNEIMPEIDEEIEIPAIEDDTDIPEIQPEEEIELPELEDDIVIPPAAEEEIDLSLADFEGLKETDEEELMLPEEEEASAPEPEMSPVSDEPVALDDLELDIPMEIPETKAQPDMSDPFAGLVEADETVLEEEQAKAEEQSTLDGLDDVQEADELDGILDGINEDIKADDNSTDLSEALEDAEESLAESEEELEEVISMGDETEQVIKELDNEEILPDEPSLELPEIENELNFSDIGADIPDTAGEILPEQSVDDISPDEIPEEAVDETADAADAEENEVLAAVETEEETEEVEVEEEVPEEEVNLSVFNTVELTPADEMEPEPEYSEPEMPKVYISAEKLVEAVYEAIDEDTLKFAIKEVLTDKIGRILEEELPILVERAIRKEIERLVKGN